MWWIIACGPNPPLVELGPPGATSEHAISVQLSEIDLDEFGDPVRHTFEWFVDGEVFEDHLDDSVAVGHTVKGQRWEVVVTPVGGRHGNSDALQIANALPSVSIYLAETAAADADLEAYLYEDDPDDGDTVDFEVWWTRDGDDSGHTDTVVPASATASGEQWTIHVVPDDGDDLGEETTATVVVD